MLREEENKASLGHVLETTANKESHIKMSNLQLKMLICSQEEMLGLQM